MATDSAVRRLYHDLTDLKEDSIIGANAEPFRNKIMKWYGLVIGVEGTQYAEIPIRLTLEFPNDYPHVAPNVFFGTEVIYRGGTKYIDASGRHIVCLDVLGNCDKVDRLADSGLAGWNPSYTVKTILLSIQSLMFDEILSTADSDIQQMKESARKFNCSITGHRGSDQSTWFPKVVTDQDEIDEIVQTHERPEHDQESNFYVCSINKSNAKKSGIEVGYAIRVENSKNGILSTPCDYLCRLAYNEVNRRLPTSENFTDWIPILVHSKHWVSLKPYLLLSVNRIVKEIATVRSDADEFTKVFKVCSAIMNSLMSEIMKNKQKYFANDKLINGYFAFYRHLLQYTTTPSFVTYVENHVNKFIQDPNYRNKSTLPNQGEALILLALTPKYHWVEIAQVFLEEWDRRSVFGYITGSKQTRSQKIYPELADTNFPVADRAFKVFAATQVSRNLIMFQFKFAQAAQALSIEDLDDNFGLAPDEMRDELRKNYAAIINVQTWEDFYDMLELPRVSVETRNIQLTEAVKRSEAAGYHRTGRVKVQKEGSDT